MNKSCPRAHVGRGGPAFSALHDGEVDAVVHAAVLGDRREDGLVVRRGVDREEAVRARGEALGHVGGHDAVAVRGRVDALEEGERFRVGGLRLVERGEGLDDDVRVPDDGARVVDLRGRGVVVGLRVGEGAELWGTRGGASVCGPTARDARSAAHLHVLNLELDGEGLVRL